MEQSETYTEKLNKCVKTYHEIVNENASLNSYIITQDNIISKAKLCISEQKKKIKELENKIKELENKGNTVKQSTDETDVFTSLYGYKQKIIFSTAGSEKKHNTIYNTHGNGNSFTPKSPAGNARPVGTF